METKRTVNFSLPLLDLKNSGLEISLANPGIKRDSENRFACQKCNKSYKNKRHLYRHVKEECVDVVPRFQCQLCYTLFRRKYHLIRHMENKHSLTDAKNIV